MTYTSILLRTSGAHFAHALLHQIWLPSITYIHCTNVVSINSISIWPIEANFYFTLMPHLYASYILLISI